MPRRCERRFVAVRSFAPSPAISCARILTSAAMRIGHNRHTQSMLLRIRAARALPAAVADRCWRAHCYGWHCTYESWSCRFLIFNLRWLLLAQTAASTTSSYSLDAVPGKGLRRVTFDFAQGCITAYLRIHGQAIDALDLVILAASVRAKTASIERPADANLFLTS